MIPPLECTLEGCRFVLGQTPGLTTDYNLRRHVATCRLATVAEREYRNHSGGGKWPPGLLRRRAGLPERTKPIARKPTGRRKAANAGATFWRRRRAVVLARDEWRCQVCGAQATDVHHKEHLSMGGSRYDERNPRNRVEALVSLCRTCHRSEHS